MNVLQFQKQKWHSGLTEQNHLATALLTQPEILTTTLAYAFGPEKYALSFLTQGTKRLSSKEKHLIGNREFQWPLMGMLKKAIPVISQETGGSTPGIGRSIFKVRLSEKYFALGDILATHSRTLVRVQEDPVQDGSEFIYALQLVQPDAALFVAPADLVAGRELSKEFSAFEELSTGGHSTEATPMWFKNQMTTTRSQFGMSGGVQTDVMILSAGSGGKKSQLWLYEREYQHMLQWAEQRERALWYSQYNRATNGIVYLPGANGRPVLTGSGALEQIEPSNTRNYVVLTERIIREFLTDLVENAYSADAKHFVGFTGYWGFDMFDSAMKDAATRFTLVDSKFITGSGSELTLGGQFKTYLGLNGTKLTLKHNPLYDDIVSNRALHPVTKKPLESYRISILDFGFYGGESNISLVAKGADGIDRSMLSWYTAGSQTPAGGSAGIKGYMNAMRSHDIDGWSCHFLSECSIKITNPLSCGELICVAS